MRSANAQYNERRCKIFPLQHTCVSDTRFCRYVTVIIVTGYTNVPTDDRCLRQWKASTLKSALQPVPFTNVERDSALSIVTRYRLDGPDIEARWGRCLPQLSRQTLGPTQAPVKRLPGLFPRGKAAGEWRWPTTPTSTEVKERVQVISTPILGLHGLLYGDLYLFLLILPYTNTYPGFEFTDVLLSKRSWRATMCKGKSMGG
jgi:hypothetical protein